MVIEDKDIIRLLRGNPQQGFRQFLAKYEAPLYWHIRRLVVSHDDAQDVAQETLVRIFRSFGQFKGPDGAFPAWIYRIATNEALRCLEHRKTEPQLLEEDADSLYTMKADDYVDYSDLEAVRLQRAILSLPTKQQVAFNLRYYDELDYEQIAQITGSNAAAAKANYHHAKEKIIAYMTSKE